jgi:hypothetical protein
MYNFDATRIYLQQSFSGLLINVKNDSLTDYFDLFRNKPGIQNPSGSGLYKDWACFIFPSQIYFYNTLTGNRKEFVINGDFKWPISQFNSRPLLNDKGPNRLELFQIWLNLPAKDKLVPPYFTMFWNADIPRRRFTDAAGRSVEREDDDAAEEGDSADERADVTTAPSSSRPVPNRAIYHLDLRACNTSQPYLEEIKRIATETSVQAVELGTWKDPAPVTLQPTTDRAAAANFNGFISLEGLSGSTAAEPLAVEPSGSSSKRTSCTDIL